MLAAAQQGPDTELPDRGREADFRSEAASFDHLHAGAMSGSSTILRMVRKYASVYAEAVAPNAMAMAIHARVASSGSAGDPFSCWNSPRNQYDGDHSRYAELCGLVRSAGVTSFGSRK